MENNKNISIGLSNEEIKKALYKQKPKAFLDYIRKGKAYYYASIEEGSIQFEIPIQDMGDADFHTEMDAKLLNRWIIGMSSFSI